MSHRAFTVVNCMLLFLALASCTRGDDVEVVTRLGRIVGSTVRAENSQNYVAFRGIPYAKPPVGQLRFAKTEPHPPFDSVFHASDFGSSCPQFVYTLHGEEQGNEDCLTLNIFVGEFNPSQKKKVLVFIHGGAFFFTSSRRFIPGTLVTREDIMVVTFNYRLGILGFLSTETDSLPGNMGLWDQNLALKWVKENIADFGGDADDITVSGVSAGSISATFHGLVPQSAGLFAKVMAFSGAATSTFGIGYTHKAAALKTAQMLGCWAGGLDANTPLDDAQNEDIARCLRQVPWEAFTQIPPIGENTNFVPRVDGAFFPDTPQRLLQDEDHLKSIGFYDRTYFLGLVNNELGIISSFLSPIIAESADPLEVIKQSSFNLIRQRLNVYDCSPVLNEIEDWYKRRYSGNLVYLNIISDMNFVAPVYDYLEAITRNETTRAYFNYFDYYPGFMKGEDKGVLHGLDLVYWWDDHLERVKTDFQVGIAGDLDLDDMELKAKYSSLIADFVIHGIPGVVLQNTEPSRWINFDRLASNYLTFNLHPTVNRHFMEAERRLWLETVPEWLKSTEN